MLFTPHALAASLISIYIQKLSINFKSITFRKTMFLMFAGAIISHFILDFIPHSHYSLYDDAVSVIFRISIDVSIAFFLLYFVFKKFLGYLWYASSLPSNKSKEAIYYYKLSKPVSFAIFTIGSAMLLDAICELAKATNWEILIRIKAFHDIFHTSIESDPVFGYFIQILISGIIFIILLNIKKELHYLEAADDIELMLKEYPIDEQGDKEKKH